jgi:hypothetical protein
MSDDTSSDAAFPGAWAPFWIGLGLRKSCLENGPPPLAWMAHDKEPGSESSDVRFRFRPVRRRSSISGPGSVGQSRSGVAAEPNKHDHHRSELRCAGGCSARKGRGSRTRSGSAIETDHAEHLQWVLGRIIADLSNEHGAIRPRVSLPTLPDGPAAAPGVPGLPHGPVFRSARAACPACRSHRWQAW